MPVLAQAPVALDSAVFVERLTANNVRSLEPASRLNRGDRVVTVLSWQRLGRPSGSNGFTLVNPLPRALWLKTGHARRCDSRALAAAGERRLWPHRL